LNGLIFDYSEEIIEYSAAGSFPGTKTLAWILILDCSMIVPSISMRRPLTITILAVMTYITAAYGVVLGIVCLLGPRIRSAAANILNRLEKPDVPRSDLSWSPGVALICILLALLVYFLADGLWKLRDGARLISLALCVLSLALGGFPFVLGLLNPVVPNDPLIQLAGRGISFALVIYLLKPQVRSAFGSTKPRKRWLVPALGALGLLGLAFDISRSATELRAVQWHMRHGDRISVNGVTFPVYRWYAPSQDDDNGDFSIKDKPGPLRSREIGSFMEVKGIRNTDNTRTVEQRVDEKFQGDVNAGYKDYLSRFPLQVGKQSLSCVQNHLLTTSISCYGDGPISSITFTGGDRSLYRFKRMLEETR
jgi:hypothetical protein